MFSIVNDDPPRTKLVRTGSGALPSTAPSFSRTSDALPELSTVSVDSPFPLSTG